MEAELLFRYTHEGGKSTGREAAYLNKSFRVDASVLRVCEGATQNVASPLFSPVGFKKAFLYGIIACAKTNNSNRKVSIRRTHHVLRRLAEYDLEVSL